ncbi:ABC transporter ATP-binding protein [Lutibacter holmesii]|uniref:ABC transporter ATP-binding protein n=1 Tax=Lutibacter holmesii TaxID=1137985 RepID=A0ABW3WMW9_9FLAO
MKTKNNIAPVLKIEALTKSFENNHVLKGFSMEMYQGENLVIMGKSGSGKSVMIKCLVGLIQPDSGIIEIMGKQISTLSNQELNHLRTEIGFLFQGSALYDSMTVRENLEFPLRKHKRNQKDIQFLVEETLDSVGLLNAINLMPEELSGGMKRRVALARALILKPKIIIYDEPTTGLDPITAKEIIQLMREIQQHYKTSSLIITHDIDCARVISNRMILLIDGMNYAEGTFQELLNSKDKKIQAFFK